MTDRLFLSITFFFLLLSGMPTNTQAQRCGTMEYIEMLKSKNMVTETTDDFEQWLRSGIRERKALRMADEVVNIPVVVHIIHNGESIGEGMNISDEQIRSQIEVLTEDFRRLNEDRTNTPTAFLPVAADIGMSFSLAARDPEGLPTDGIVRVNGGRDEWLLSDNYALKSLSHWPPEDYLNMWVTNLGNNFIGFAQFPISMLDGLEEGTDSRLIDGVVIDFEAFGSILKYPEARLKKQYNLGRTTSHEVGHFFGLRHIWGDADSCSQDDFCDDTPPQSKNNNGLSNCSYPGSNSCRTDIPDLSDMFQNFMDYTNDICMNLFTKDQKARMRTVLDNSPRRAELKTSPGSIPPVFVANDLGIRQVISPDFSLCGDTFSPRVQVRNYGTNMITRYEVAVRINDKPEVAFVTNTSLESLDTEEIVFEEMVMPDTPGFDMTVRVISVNRTADGNEQNDEKTERIRVPAKVLGIGPVTFDEKPMLWTTFNEDRSKGWEVIEDKSGNSALSVEFYNYTNKGASDFYISPAFSLATATSAQLVFDVAFSKRPEVSQDALMVVIAPQCESPFTKADTIYYKQAAELAEGHTSSAFFTPGVSDWRQETINLAPYIGFENLQIAFVAINGKGNNLYIDNIALQKIENRILSPPPVSCLSRPNLALSIVNTSGRNIDRYRIAYTLDNRPQSVVDNSLTEPLPPGFGTTFETDLGQLSNGLHKLLITIELPFIPSDTRQYQFYIDDAGDVIPIRETMDDVAGSSWLVVNQDGSITWQQTDSDEGSYLKINNEDYETAGERDWFVSPMLDFSRASAAILTFGVAYSGESDRADRLEVLVSTDCGESYDHPVFVKAGSSLSTANFTGEPNRSDWRTENVDLADYLGRTGVRIAFISTNQNGKPVFIDDIQVYVTDFTGETADIVFPNPTTSGIFGVKFDLVKKENIELVIYDDKGQIFRTYELPNTLNQRYSLDISAEPAGVYLIRITGDSFSTTKRVVKTF